MHRKVAITIMALSLGGYFILTSPPASAQLSQQQQQKKAQGQSRGGGNVGAPRGAARTFTRPAARTFTRPAARTFTRPAARTFTRPAARTITSPSGATARTVTLGRLRGMPGRGAGRATIRGHNFSVWRSGYRVRHRGGWRTFMALNALSAIAVGSSSYYPYAYISAPQPYCEGLTEDGCQLMWQEVETVEGDVVSQCVAYCPWQ